MQFAWREGFVLRFCALTTSSVHGKARIKELSVTNSVAWRQDQQMFLLKLEELFPHFYVRKNNDTVIMS